MKRVIVAAVLLAACSGSPRAQEPRDYVQVMRVDGCAVYRFEDRVDANTVNLVYFGCSGIAVIRK